MNARDWVKGIQELMLRDGAEKVPAGWKTSLQIAKEAGKSRATVDRHLEFAVKQKRAQSRVFNINNGKRGLHPVRHYLLQ